MKHLDLGSFTIGELIAIFIISIVIIVFARFFYVWFTRIRPRVPSTEADWNTDCEFQSKAIIEENHITFTKIRDFTWRTTRDRDEKWDENVKFDLREIKDVWFIVDHFHKIHGLAHTFLSIEFNDGRCISISFEARRVKGKRYHPWKGLWRSYELYLLIGYERDLLGLRTNARGNKDYLFRAVTPPGKDRQLLLAIAQKMNQLSETAEWYHSFFTTCNTSIVKVVNKITPGRIPFIWRNFLPGYTPKAAFKLGLIEDWGGLEKTLQIARVDELAKDWDGKSDYSTFIRKHMPNSPVDKNQ
ncbi:MAG: DUF4105 domain-containing protein [Candidatus Thermoplasmatota archaeon]|mgnify:FL=1|nr:DUF4105 domain-containing protein [Candidatus Thermoplasmatota archaeon]HII51195.1 DUF4105 domain-containing protein [Candidatus Poseidoniaceae archaeon]